MARGGRRQDGDAGGDVDKGRGGCLTAGGVWMEGLEGLERTGSGSGQNAWAVVAVVAGW